jgi:hypothetical protein
VRSFIRTARYPLDEEGLTHASMVMPVVRSRLAASAIVTQLVVPLNESALPKRPELFQVAPLIVPVLPLPDASAVVGPLPSLKPYAATRPVWAAAARANATVMTAKTTAIRRTCARIQTLRQCLKLSSGRAPRRRAKKVNRVETTRPRA